MLRPDDYPRIFGTNFAKRNMAPIITCGKRSYTKYDLGRIGAPHVQAAREVDRALKQLGASSLEDVARRFSPIDFVLKDFGVTSFYTLTCLLIDARLSLRGFYREKVTFDTLKDQKAHRKRRRRAA